MAATGQHGDADLILGSAPRRARLTAVSPVPGARDPKLAERVAAAIEADVLRAGWPVGLVLGSEEQLAARYGVGRAVIREAIRLAEHRQVARMRRGRGGGLVVVAPDASAVTESLAIYLEYAQVGIDDLLDARAMLEVFAAATAAGSIDEAGLLALRDAALADDGRAIGEQAGSGPAGPGAAGPGAATRIHELIAEATGNAALSLFIQAIVSLSDQMTRGRADAAAGPGGSAARSAELGHLAVIEAITAGDALLARDRMREHMTSRHAELAQAGSAAMLGPDDPDPGAPPAATAGSRPYRPANAVATRIRREIVRRGWPVGESLGFEGDLLRKYGVGRAQFREAIRILEDHSVVRMQRGAAGGMVVAMPDGRAVVRTASLYLTYQGMNSGHIRDLREELEAATTRMAIDRLDAAGEDRLRAMIELERTWPDEDFPAVSHDLHAVIAELGGNQTLALLLSIVMQLSAERMYSGDLSRVSESANATRHAHQAIVDAMLARDTALALRRMRKHLAALAHSTLDQPARRPADPAEGTGRRVEGTRASLRDHYPTEW
jgi:DNA-binding FadR family transcriptional regulator